MNAKPVGEIHSTGNFGPWHADDPRESPVNGDYTFTHADLGPIKGIAESCPLPARMAGRWAKLA